MTYALPISPVPAVSGLPVLIDVSGFEIRLPLGFVIAGVLAFAIILVFIVRLALRSRHAKVTTGTAGMIGLVGRAQTRIAPEGTVFVRGELWRARSYMEIAEGEAVRVTGVEGLTLAVEADSDVTIEPRKTSAIAD